MWSYCKSSLQACKKTNYRNNSNVNTLVCVVSLVVLQPVFLEVQPGNEACVALLGWQRAPKGGAAPKALQ